MLVVIFYTFWTAYSTPVLVDYEGRSSLVVFLVGSWVLVRARQEDWPSLDLREGLGGNWGAFGADGCTNGHEKPAGRLVSRFPVVRIGMHTQK